MINNHLNSENELLSLLKSGDKNAFTQLYHLYSERLYLNLLKLVKSDEIAGEILQEIFVLIWEKRTTIEVQTSFRSYLFRIGENKVNDFFRKVKRDKNLYGYIKSVASENYTYIEEEMLSRENVELLKKAIDKLPPQRKHVFELCKIQGKSYQEVSQLLGISTSTINDHIVKATRSIREFIHFNREITDVLILFLLYRE